MSDIEVSGSMPTGPEVAKAARVREFLTANPKRTIIAGVVVMALLVGLGVVLVRSAPYSESEQLVVDYLEAIADRDVDKARELGGGIPAGFEVDERFLSAEAIDPNWYIDTVADKGVKTMSDESQLNAVTVSLSVDSGDTVSHRFVTVRDAEGEKWKFTEPPYAIVKVQDLPFEVMEINGQTENIAENTSTFALFPGAYDFFGSLSDYFTVDANPVLLTPGDSEIALSGTDGRNNPLPLTMSDAAEEETQQLVDDYVDDCVAEAEPVVRECPFGIDVVRAADVPEDNEISDVTWEVVDYPEITLVHQGSEVEVADRVRGTMQASGTAVDEDGTEFEYQVECDVTANVFVVDMVDDGGPSLRLNDEMQWRIDEQQDSLLEWHTC